MISPPHSKQKNLCGRYDIEHVTTINNDIPIEFVWKHLIDLDDWKNWNKWTRLSTVDERKKRDSKQQPPKEGMKGKLVACYAGDDNDWKSFDFVFGPIQPYVLTWIGKVGPGLFYAYHTMELHQQQDGTINLIHREHFEGILPRLGMGLPYKQLDENYLKMNESFKSYVESKFRSTSTGGVTNNA